MFFFFRSEVMTPGHRPVAAGVVALVLGFLCLSTAANLQADVVVAPPASFTLDNGLQVVVIPDHRTPVVTQMIWYKVGSADETPGKSGLAHFLEHLMFKGTAAHPAGEFSRAVLRAGGDENAFTSSDYTGYYQRVPRDQLPVVMEFEADRMTGLVLTDENVLPERDVVLEEYNLRVTANLEARLAAQMMAALYLRHPYGRPVIGERQEIEKLNREDALAFYRRFYAPNNAILVIAGDTDAAEVRPLAQRTFGRIATQPSIPAQRIRPQEPNPVTSRSFALSTSGARVERPSLRRYYLVPSAATGAGGESAALDVLAQLMGGGSSSYLYRALVVDRPLALSVTASYLGTALDPTQFSIAVVPKADAELAEVARVLDGVVADLAQHPLAVETLDRVKTQLIAQAVYAQDNHSTQARWYGGSLATGLGIEDVRSWPDRIRAVTAEQVRAAAAKWLKCPVTGYLPLATDQSSKTLPPPSDCQPPAPAVQAAAPAASAAVAAAPQDRRVALVIGNSVYRNVAGLPNAVHDASSVGAALRSAGFQSVVVQTDLTRDKMLDTLRVFAGEASTADWAVVYYAGHGMEVGGVNYLIPVDASLKSDLDVSLEAISLDQVLNAAGRAQALRLIILDACRENPFAGQMKRMMTTASRSVTRGLARVEPDPGTLVVYAAKEGETASDGDASDSPFSVALLKNLLTPNLEVRRLFEFVRDDVMDATGRQQQPFIYGSLSARREYYFVAKK
jgi:zinc protease